MRISGIPGIPPVLSVGRGGNPLGEFRNRLDGEHTAQVRARQKTGSRDGNFAYGMAWGNEQGQSPESEEERRRRRKRTLDLLFLHTAADIIVP